jgi:hypothetical protein
MVGISTPSPDAITVGINSQFRLVAGSRFSDKARWARILTVMNINVNGVATSEIVFQQPVSYLLQLASGKPRTDHSIAFLKQQMDANSFLFSAHICRKEKQMLAMA